MKQKINLKWYINRLESVARNHKSLHNDETFKAVMRDLNRLKGADIFRL
jgi:hypothetical protein